MTTARKPSPMLGPAPSQRRWLISAAAILLLRFAVSVWSQERELSELLSGNVYPLSISVKELTNDWRRIAVHTTVSVSDNVSVNVSGNSSSATSQNNLVGALASSRFYVTKGQTASAAGRKYLVAYHLPGSALDLGVLLQALATKTPPTAAILTPDTILPLTLLDLQTIGSLDDIRAFDLKSEISESQRAARSLSDLFRVQGGSGSTNAASSPKRDPDK